MFTVEKREGCLVFVKDGQLILERFEKVKPDTHFDGYYLGFSAEKEGGVVLFNHEGEFVYKFSKVSHDLGVSKLLDDIVSSQNIVQSMKRIYCLSFWTDKEIARSVRLKHFDLNKKRMAASKNQDRVDVLYEVEKRAIEKFLCGKQMIKMSKERAATCKHQVPENKVETASGNCKK